MIGDIMSISRLRMGSDGKGVSTLVLFFDCPLHCAYCINDYCHETEEHFDDVVPRVAYTPKELVKVLEKDDIYYKMSEGGIVFGGGEPLLQSAFIHEVCKLSDPMWKKRIETSLNVPWRYVEPLIDDIDEWIIDIKDMDSDIYKEYTGVSNKNLRDNLFRIRDILPSEKIHIRIPKIKGYNKKKNIDESVEWIRRVLNVEPEVFEYHVVTKVNKNSWIDDDDEDV